MRSVFERYDDIELDINFLDSKLYYTNDYLALYDKLLVQKYRNKKIDVVITSDDNAYIFFEKYRNEIAPGVPWIFCGVNNIAPEAVSRKKKIYGIDENRSIRKNIDMVLTIQPDVKCLLFVTDNTTTGMSMKKDAEQLKKKYPGIKFEFTGDLSETELIERLKKLPEKCAVIHLIFARDREGRYYHDSGMKLVMENARVPVYTFRDFGMDTRVLGGVVSNGVLQGEMVAILAMNLINNNDIPSLPLLQHPEQTSIVNYNNLKRFGLHQKFLPDHYIVGNKPESLYSLYHNHKVTVLSVLFLILCLIAIIIVLTVNIKLRKQIQRKLESEEERLRITLDSIGDAVISTDTNGRIMKMNPMAENLTGWNFYEASGMFIDRVLFFLDAADKTGQSQKFAERMSFSQANMRLNGYVISKDTKQKFLVHGSINRILNLSGKVVGHVFVFHDMTEQHKTEMLLQQSQKMDSLGQLAGGVAHDLNNMLFAILGSANIIDNRCGDDQKIKKLTGNIICSSERAAELVAKLLLFSRKSTDVKNTVDVNKVVEDAISILLHSIAKNITIDSRLNATPSNVVGNYTQLQNAIINLGVNARDAMPHGGTLSICTSNVFLDSSSGRYMLIDSPPGYYVQIAVSDTGKGIPKENISKIFDPFFTTKDVGKGTGLGLSIIYRTIKDMSGTVYVYSEEGEGTAFKILLPLAVQDAVSGCQEAVEEMVSGEGHILIIDDEDLVRNTIESTLQECGYTCMSADNGAKGIELFRKHADWIDVVMLDMILPGLSVKDIYEALVEIKPDVKILLMSGFAEISSIEEMSQKCSAFLSKPFSLAKLSRTLKDLLG